MPRVLEGPAETRAIHNGFLTEATDWGVQGFVLMFLFLSAVWRASLRGRRLALDTGDAHAVMVFACMAAGLLAWMVSSVFGDYLNQEWGFWVAAMAYSYLRVHTAAVTVRVGEAVSASGPQAAPVTPSWRRSA
jgi:hypothetical protein